MNVYELNDRMLVAFRDRLSPDFVKARGERLRQNYRETADRYAKIVEVAGGKQVGGASVSEAINLGTSTLPEIGRVGCSATVRISHYAPASTGTNPSDRRPATAYRTEVAITGRDERGRTAVAQSERFGGFATNFTVMRMPFWLRAPHARREEPWGREGGWHDFASGDEYPWDMSRVAEVGRRITPMIRDALATQQLLIVALQTPELNPRFADRALDELTPPFGHPAPAAP